MERGKTTLFFNTASGQLCIDGSQATTSNGDLVELHTLLTNPQQVLDIDPYKCPPAKEWSHDDVIWIGSIVARSFIEHDPPLTVTANHLKTLHTLGLLPDQNYIRSHFSSISNFQELIGAPLARPSTKFDHMTRENLVELLSNERDEMGIKGPFTIEGIRMLFHSGITPGFNYLQKRFGSLGELNEYFGFTNTKNWDSDDCIQYGVRILEELGPEYLYAEALDLLAKHKHGIYALYIAKRFNSSLVLFQEAVFEAFEKKRLLSQQRQKVIDAHFASHPIKDSHNQEKRKMIYGLFEVARSVLGKGTPEIIIEQISYQNPNDALAMILQRRPHLNAADIEIEAEILGVFDDIWPCKTLNIRPLTDRITQDDDY